MKRGIYVIVSIVLVGYFTLAHAEDKGLLLVKEVYASGTACAISKPNYSDKYNCWINTTPEKCRPYMMELLSHEDKEAPRRTLNVCIMSCAALGVWANTFGECSRKGK